jgi:hypothetical protein
MGNHHLGPTTGQNMGHCIAVWCSWKNELPGPEPEAELKLHVNLWRLDRKLNGVAMNALDLGLQVSKATSVALMHLFVPFSVNSDSITDLGVMLADADMAIAIFNEEAQVRGTAQNQSSFSIQLGEEELSCWKLQPKYELKFEDVTNSNSTPGTIITFDPKVFAVVSDQTTRYVRLRINLSSEAEAAFFTRYDPADRWFLSGFDEIEVVDFRFNEARNLPRSVIERMTRGLRILEINYFIIRDITHDLTLSHSELKKCRTLESLVWSKYVQCGLETTIPLRNAIIFYWQKVKGNTSSIKDYNALARFRRRKTGLRAINWFVFSTLLLGIVAGLISGGFVAYIIPTPAASPSATDRPAAQSESNRPKLLVRPIPTEKPSTSG